MKSLSEPRHDRDTSRPLTVTFQSYATKKTRPKLNQLPTAGPSPSPNPVVRHQSQTSTQPLSVWPCGWSIPLIAHLIFGQTAAFQLNFKCCTSTYVCKSKQTLFIYLHQYRAIDTQYSCSCTTLLPA